MSKNVIREALDMLRDVDVLNPERCAQVIDEAVRMVQAELDKGPENNDERPWMNEWQRNMCKKSKAALIHEIEQEREENDKLRKHPAAAGLTVEEVMEAIEDNIAEGYHPLFRARLAAAIEAKNRKP